MTSVPIVTTAAPFPLNEEMHMSENVNRRKFAQISTALLCSSALLRNTSIGRAADESVATSHADLTTFRGPTGARQPIEDDDHWKERRLEILTNMQTVMGPFPKDVQVDLDVKVVGRTTLDDGLQRHKLSYHTDSKKRRVNAWLLFDPKQTQSKKSAAVLCLHQTTRIGKDEPAGLGGKPNLHYALHLARRGFVTLAPDYPSFGEYAYDFPASDGYISGTMKAIVDNVRAIDLLESLPSVDAKRIGCIGHSLGGHNAMFTAAFDERIQAIVSNCGFTRFHKYYNGRLKGWTSNRYMPLINSKFGNDPNQVPFDFPEIIGLCAPRAFLASSPVSDSNFEVSGVRDSIKAASFVYRLLKTPDRLKANYPKCGHDFPTAARDVAYAFMEKHLKQ